MNRSMTVAAIRSTIVTEKGDGEKRQKITIQVTADARTVGFVRIVRQVLVLGGMTVRASCATSFGGSSLSLWYEPKKIWNYGK